MNRSKRKGDNFEREVVHEAQALGLKAYRNFVSRSPTSDKVDVVVAGRQMQVKKRAKGFRTLYREIDGVDGLILGADYKKPLVVLRLQDWLKLL